MGDTGPALSPDGRTLAFVRTSRVYISDLYLLELSEDFTPQGEPRRLTSESRRIWSPVWTPDGGEIIFSSRGSGLWKISVLRPGAPARLTAAGQAASSPEVSRQGNRLAYTRAVFDTNFRRMQRPDPESSPGPPTRFLSSTRREAFPKYSADGERIVFESRRTGVTGIWISDADGSNPKLLHSEESTHAGVPSWSPDSQRIAFNWNPEEQFDIYVISASGGKPLQLTTDPADDQWPSWSRDGQWVYFASRRSGRQEIWKISAPGGAAVQVTRQGGFVAAESPDAKHVYYIKRDQGRMALWKVPASGGEETQVFAPVFNFSVVERGIYFIPALNPDDPEESSSLQFLDFASNNVKTIASLPTDQISVGLAVSPDERTILYNQFDDSGSDLMLIEGFR